MAEEKGKGKAKKRVKRHPSALKRQRQSEKRWGRNRAFISQMRSRIKELRQAFDAKDKSKADTLIKTTLPFISKMASKGVIHRNTAARYTSRLLAHLHKL